MGLLKLYNFSLNLPSFLSLSSTPEGHEPNAKSKMLLNKILSLIGQYFSFLRKCNQCSIHYMFPEYSAPDWGGIFRSFSDKDSGPVLIHALFSNIILELKRHALESEDYSEDSFWIWNQAFSNQFSQ